jgi:hypothetical protein
LIAPLRAIEQGRSSREVAAIQALEPVAILRKSAPTIRQDQGWHDPKIPRRIEAPVVFRITNG